MAKNTHTNSILNLDIDEFYDFLCEKLEFIGDYFETEIIKDIGCPKGIFLMSFIFYVMNNIKDVNLIDSLNSYLSCIVETIYEYMHKGESDNFKKLLKDNIKNFSSPINYDHLVDWISDINQQIQNSLEADRSKMH